MTELRNECLSEEQKTSVDVTDLIHVLKFPLFCKLNIKTQEWAAELSLWSSKTKYAESGLVRFAPF